jgi:hypothetical protein
MLRPLKVAPVNSCANGSNSNGFSELMANPGRLIPSGGSGLVRTMRRNPMSMIPVLSLVIVSITVLTTPCRGESQAASSEQEFRKAMAGAKEAHENAEIKAKTTHYRPDGNSEVIDENDKLRGPYSVSEWTRIPRSGQAGKANVYASNARYRFELRRKDDAWVITEVLPPYNKYKDLQSPFALPMTTETYSSALSRSDT